MLDAAGHGARARFADAQLARLVIEPDYAALRDSLIAWCESGFNLVGTAARLSIHRNTVVYRLDKIAALTGRNPRDPKIAVAMYLACLV
ncbi:sugar diacid utilization regulator [Nocardia sp. GAS34]|uniref:PucR family transcriptional regulator n=1 Tax=unclassified Nocardia TaxID=2637762 RepID=UPI003D19CFB2